MNKHASKPLVQNYICRKCTRTKFKNSIEFTKHLQKCKGSAAEIVLLPPLEKVKSDGKLRADLIEASIKAAELKALLDSLIKRVK
jgi:hypothetical protein